MFSGNTETNITVTYQDADGTIDLAATDTNTTYSEATSSDAGLMSTAHHDKLDGIESGATADQTQADINGLAITTVGTIDSGTWQGTAIASAYLDSDTAHLSGTQTFSGDKTFEKKLILDGDKSVTAGSDGVTLHVDAQDITNTSTSGSGTAATFNHVVIENPRLMATNSSVTTTNASTVYIKGAPVAHTNQTITNAYSLYVAAGNSHFEGTLSCDDLDITGSSNALTINSTTGNVAINASSTDADCIIRVADNSTAGTNVIGLVATGDDSIIRNDEGNFKVNMANNATTTLDLDQNGNLSLTGNILPGITEVKILPRDFIPDDGGRPAMIDDTGSDRWLESHGTLKLYANVEIPIGFKATHVHIYGSATSAITVYEADVNSKTVTSKGTGNIGTNLNITDVTADATNYILIELSQASGEEVYGGIMTIAKV